MILSQSEMHILFSFTVTYLQAELSKKVYYTHRVNRVNYAAFMLTKLPLIFMQNSCIFSTKCRSNVVSLHINKQMIEVKFRLY